MSSAKSSVRANSIFPSRTGGSDSASAVAISSSALIPSRTAADARSIAILLLEKRTAAPAFVRGSRRIIAMILAAMLNDTKHAQNPAQAFSLLLPIKFGSRIREVVSHFIALCCRHDRTAQLIAPAIRLGKASRGGSLASDGRGG